MTSESYWTIGHGLTTLLPMYLLTFSAVAVLVNEFMARIKVYKQGQPLARTDQLPIRIVAILKAVLLQSKVLRVKGAGLEEQLKPKDLAEILAERIIG